MGTHEISKRLLKVEKKGNGMRCNKCGKQIMEDNKYCLNCENSVAQPKKKKGECNNDSSKVEYAGDAIMGLSSLSALLCIVILVFWGDSGTRRLLFVLTFIVGLLFPLKVLVFSELSSNERKLIITSSVSSLLMMLLAFFSQRGWSFENMIEDLFYINTFPVYLWVYLILLIASLYYSNSNRKVALCLISILVGLTLPIIIAGIIIVIIILLNQKSNNDGICSNGNYDSFDGGDGFSSSEPNFSGEIE